MCLIYQYTYTLSSLMITLIHLIRHHINYHQSINQYSVFHFIKFLIFSVHRMEFSTKEFIWTVQKISKFLLSMCRIYSGKYPCFKHVYLSHIYNIIVRWHCYTRSGDTEYYRKWTKVFTQFQLFPSILNKTTFFQSIIMKLIHVWFV
jgi:hypothetical protein